MAFFRGTRQHARNLNSGDIFD